MVKKHFDSSRSYSFLAQIFLFIRPDWIANHEQPGTLRTAKQRLNEQVRVFRTGDKNLSGQHSQNVQSSKRRVENSITKRRCKVAMVG